MKIIIEEEVEYKHIFSKPNQLIVINKEDLTALQSQLVDVLLYKVQVYLFLNREKDLDLNKTYTVTIEEVEKILQVKEAYLNNSMSRMKATIEALAKINIKSYDELNFGVLNIFQSIFVKQTNNFMGYCIEYKLNNDILIAMSREDKIVGEEFYGAKKAYYTQYDLDSIGKYNLNKSERSLYEVLMMYFYPFSFGNPIRKIKLDISDLNYVFATNSRDRFYLKNNVIPNTINGLNEKTKANIKYEIKEGSKKTLSEVYIWIEDFYDSECIEINEWIKRCKQGGK